MLFLGITANARCHWLKRDAVAVRPYVACSFHALSNLVLEEEIFESLKCKDRSPNELHLYIADGKCILSMYCANVSVQPLLHSSLLRWFHMGRTVGHPSKGPLPLMDLKRHLIHGSFGPPESSTQTASRSFFTGAHERDQQTDRPPYSVCSNS